MHAPALGTPRRTASGRRPARAFTAIGVAFTVAAVAGCSHGPADEDARAVRASVIAWFRAIRRADVAGVAAAMSASCPPGTADALVESYRAASSAGLQDASVGDVDVVDVRGDQAEATITVDLAGTFGSGSSDPRAFVLVREDGTWVVSC